MTLKQFWAGTGKWLRARKPFTGSGPRPEIDEDGLISRDEDTQEPSNEAPPSSKAEGQGDKVMVKAVPPIHPQESL